MKSNTRQNGIYYTSLFNPFDNAIFKDWINTHTIQKETILEPFAGNNSIIHMLQEIGMASHYTSYDIYPQSKEVQKRDTIQSYPKGYKVCITNPPWLYKSSAQRRKLYYPDTHYDNIYKLCLSLALDNNEYVGALIPASFIQSQLFTDRLEILICINRLLFENTENPVCLALFSNRKTKDIEIYSDDRRVGKYTELKKCLPNTHSSTSNLTFNDPSGDLGLIAIDNNREPSIRFCHGEQLNKYTISHSSRSITRIQGIDVSEPMLKRLNDCIDDIREKTDDIFLTAFKGLRKDGKYRRRIEYSLARDIIQYAQ